MSLNVNARRAAVSAKQMMDNVFADCEGTGFLEENGVSEQAVLRMIFALDDVVRGESISYDEAEPNAAEVSVGHWSEVDDALKTVRDILEDDGAMDEIACDYPDVADTVRECIESFQIDY